MDSNEDKEKFGLTDDEANVLALWKKGYSQTEAYRNVMIINNHNATEDEIMVNDKALTVRASRFFKRKGLIEATKYYKRSRKKAKAKEKLIEEVKYRSRQAQYQEVEEPEIVKTVQEKWLDSLKVSEDPSAFTVYGTGQFIIYNAVQEMMNRKAYIKQNNISPLSRDGSIFTANILSALKTAASMILPYAPTPSRSDRKEMSKAAILLGLLPDSIVESPDDFTAPIPASAEIVESED